MNMLDITFGQALRSLHFIVLEKNCRSILFFSLPFSKGKKDFSMKASKRDRLSYI